MHHMYANNKKQAQLMGMLEKKRVINLYQFIAKVNPEDSNTWGGMNLVDVPF